MAESEDCLTEELSGDPLAAGAVGTLEGEVADIERALVRLDDGTYGTCEVCGQRLSDALLQERPAARFCAAHLPMTLD